MVSSFVADLKVVLARAALAPSLASNIECKHFFSGAAAYTNGKIFMSLTPVGLALKLPAESCQQLLESGGKPLRYFPKAPIKKGYVVLPETVLADSRVLGDWIQTSLSYCQDLARQS